MKKYILVMIIGILFLGIGIYVINNNYQSMKADSINYNNAKVTNISYINNKLRIDVTKDIKEICIKTTKSKPDKNNICFNKINNTTYISIYKYKKYYLWTKDNNNIISDYIEINNIKK